MTLETLINKQTLRPGALFLACLALVIACFAPSFQNLWDQWQTAEYSHGIIIPFVALWIGWHALSAQGLTAHTDTRGFWLSVGGFVLLAFSHLSAFEPLAHYGLLLSLIGLCWAFCGSRATRVLVPAFVYFFFCIPLPRLIYVALSEDMQLISSNLGVLFLDLANVSVFQEGNIIDLGSQKLMVAEACNGLRYLFPLTSFSFLLAYLYDDRFWKKAVLFLSAAPITILLNALRLTLIGITVDQWGIGMAEGLIHDIEGWVVFSICVAFLFGEMALLNVLFPPKLGQTGGLNRLFFEKPKAKIFAAWTAPRTDLIKITALFLLLAPIFISGVIDTRDEIIPDHPPLQGFPTSMSGWHGAFDPLDTDTLKELRPSDYLVYRFTNPQVPTWVELYIAYYDSQRVGTSIHSPANCIPGSGWRTLSKEIRAIDTGTASLPVTRMVLSSNESKTLIYYWFEERGRIINDQYGAKWYLFIDSITMHRTDGALVRFATPIPPGESESDADQRLQGLLRSSYPEIKRFIPGA